MIINSIYFNHYGLLICNEANFKSLLKELIDSIDFCRNNQCQLAIYWDLYSICLSFSPKNFVDFLCSNKDFYNYSVVLFDYLSKCKKYPSSDLDLIQLKKSISFWDGFVMVCDHDGPDVVLSLSNDNYVDSFFAKKNYGLISNVKSKADLNIYIKNSIKFKSIMEVFEYIKKCHGDKFDYISNSVKHSCRQLGWDFDTCRKIYVAITCLIEIILPFGSNDLTKSIQDEFKKESKFEISGETPQTLSDRNYKAKRSFAINGKKYLFENHVKIKNNNEYIRIHFYILNNVLYIGYCGKHLPTSTQST